MLNQLPSQYHQICTTAWDALNINLVSFGIFLKNWRRVPHFPNTTAINYQHSCLENQTATGSYLTFVSFPSLIRKDSLFDILASKRNENNIQSRWRWYRKEPESNQDEYPTNGSAATNNWSKEFIQVDKKTKKKANAVSFERLNRNTRTRIDRWSVRSLRNDEFNRLKSIQLPTWNRWESCQILAIQYGQMTGKHTLERFEKKRKATSQLFPIKRACSI